MMSGSEAFRIARKTLAEHHDLELVRVDGKGRMIPRDRKPGGEALKPEAQEAADAYNWLADNDPSTQRRW